MLSQLNDILVFIENSYLDERFLFFTIYPILLSGFVFFIFSLPYFFMDFYNWEFTKKYRIDPNRKFDLKSIRKSLILFLLNWSAQLLASVLLWPLISLNSIHIQVLPSFSEIILQLIICLVIDDFLFFLFHKILHRPWFFKRIHYVHHEISNPYSFAAGHFHILEYLILSISFLAGPVMLGVHFYVFYFWIVIRQWIAVEGHSGYNFPISIQKYLPLQEGNTFHDLHHRNVKCNFGLYLNLIDRLSGTWQKFKS